MDLYINMGATLGSSAQNIVRQFKGHSTERVPFASKLFRKKNHFLSFLKTESSKTHI